MLYIKLEGHTGRGVAARGKQWPLERLQSLGLAWEAPHEDRW